MKADDALPDHLRCNRTDGRQWRCNRPVMEDKKLCEIHYLQGKHRQHKEKVPESLKIQRRTGKSEGKVPALHNLKIRAQKIEKPGRRAVRMRRKNLARELVRIVVKREAEKRREVEGSGGEDMMRRLPNGVMVISQSAARRQQQQSGGANDNVGSQCDVKVGVDANVAPRRRFRSKNLEPLPIGAVQVMPYKRNVEKVGRKKCHWCKSSGATSLIKCSSCRKHHFCLECIEGRYFDTQEEVKMECPVCRKTCRCKACLAYKYKDSACQELSSDHSRADKILHSHHLISVLLPVLKEINEERSIELEVEAKVKGTEVSQLQVHQVECGFNKQYCCNNCRTSILDLHRSCSSCSYNLCLSCYWDFYRGILPKGVKLPNNKYDRKRKASVQGHKQLSAKSISKLEQKYGGKSLTVSMPLATSKAGNGDDVSCPPWEFGCCDNARFNLQSFFPINWSKELEKKAEEVVCSYDLRENSDGSLCCPLCHGDNHEAVNTQLQQAATRRTSNDNFLYYPTASEVHADKCEHFQKHWVRGHPVIVRDILWRTSDLNWDPVAMFCTHLDGSIAKCENEKEASKASPCLEWSEVEISMRQSFIGSFRGKARESIRHEKLEIKSWLSSRYFREQFPAHYAEILSALPLQDYMNPDLGRLNLATMLPLENMSAEIGPYVYISYCSPNEHPSEHFGSKLCYDLCDVVNILANTTDDVSPDKINRIKKLMRKRQAQDKKESTGAPNGELLGSDIENSSEVLDVSIEEMQIRKKMAKVTWLATASEESPCLIAQDNKQKQDHNSTSMEDIQQNLYENQTESHGHYMKKVGKSCGAQWDVFRREDVPKLEEYFRRYSAEFMQPCGSQKHVVHPILDQCYFLDEYHKLRLKEEFEIEPWTFEQHVGEAVLIPAGCPYQIRNPKSSVNVILHFISPESAAECIHLIDELRLLPEGHEARLDKLEVKKMAVHSLTRAIDEIRELTSVKDNAEA